MRDSNAEMAELMCELLQSTKLEPIKELEQTTLQEFAGRLENNDSPSLAMQVLSLLMDEKAKERKMQRLGRSFCIGCDGNLDYTSINKRFLVGGVKICSRCAKFAYEGSAEQPVYKTAVEEAREVIQMPRRIP